MSFLPAITIPGVDTRDGRYSRGRRAHRCDPGRTRPLGKNRIMTTARLTRTYLAVPAHRSRLVQNAAASVADAVFLDLEDAVPPAEKATALEAAATALATHDWGRKTVAVQAECDRQPIDSRRDRAPRRYQTARRLHDSESRGRGGRCKNRPLDHRRHRNARRARRDGIADRNRARADQRGGAGGRPTLW